MKPGRTDTVIDGQEKRQEGFLPATMHLRPFALTPLLVGVLSACATTDSRSPDAPGDESAAVNFEARTELPLTANALSRNDSDRLVETDLRAGVGDNLVEIRTRYSVASGELVRNVGKRYQQGQSIPTQLARQSVEHAVRLSTPGELGAPLQVGFDQKEASVLTLNGQHRQESTRAHLAWEPDPFEFLIEWTPPRKATVAGNPFDCTLEGRLRMPTDTLSAGMDSVLDLSQSECMVYAPDRGVDALPVQARGLVWSWGEEFGSAVHVNRVALQMPMYGRPEMAAGYEVGLRQNHSFHGWHMEADLALRQADSVPYHDSMIGEDSRWAVDLQLSRQLQAFALTARWMQAGDPLWFVPEASPVGRESLSLLLDFSSWLTGLMPGMDAGMSASWRHTEDAEGRDDNHFRWDFTLSW